MEKTDIAAKAHCINNRQDLLTLLNEVKTDILGEKAYPISMKQLCYYCNPDNIKHRYFDFEIPKKSGGKRRISAPVGGLKSILRCLNVVFQAMYQPSEYAMGFAQGLSVVDNARKHVGMNYVLNLDLKDFSLQFANQEFGADFKCNHLIFLPTLLIFWPDYAA